MSALVRRIRLIARVVSILLNGAVSTADDLLSELQATPDPQLEQT